MAGQPSPLITGGTTKWQLDPDPSSDTAKTVDTPVDRHQTLVLAGLVHGDGDGDGDGFADLTISRTQNVGSVKIKFKCQVQEAVVERL